MKRRDALKLLGLSAFVGFTGCRIEPLPSLKQYDYSQAYSKLRDIENERVEELLKQFSNQAISGDVIHSKRKILNIAFMTDSHIDLGSNVSENYQNVRDSISFCNSSLAPISAILQGGDIVTKIKETKQQHLEHLKEYFDMGWEARVPLLYTKGNHDLNSIQVSASKLLSDDDWGRIWYNKAESEYGIIRNIKCNGQKSGYYYYDLNQWRVRIISVDCFDVDYSKSDSEGNILYWGGTSWYIANEQFNWIVKQALNFDDKEEKDWGVIIFMHFYRPSDKDGTTIEPIFDSVYKKLNSMLLAFNKQTAFSIQYSFPENQFYNLSVSGDWTRYAKLDKKPYLICILSGHQHRDIYANWYGNTHLVTANQFCGKEFSDERIERDPGTRRQNLFDIINIDLEERKLRVIRYGASANLNGDEGNRFLPDGLTF